MENTRLTQYSRGGGCGCKISPKALEEILKSDSSSLPFNNLLVGNETCDDAAVYDLGDGTALISTVDFFTPIVDDPFDFGYISSANAISDVYAMGGKPLMAVAILGWPVEKLDIGLARRVIEGAKKTCSNANISLAGGHSIDSEEPIFGLAVTGKVKIDNLKKNDTAKEGDLIFLTKSLGVGILSTAGKRGLLTTQQNAEMISQMSELNSVGEKLGTISSVTAMTDITGFGLIGHLIEMTEGSGLSAELDYSKIKILSGVRDYIKQRVFPDATTRNWNAYSEKIKFEKGVNVMEAFTLLPDPQTNGGLLISVNKSDEQRIRDLTGTEPIGRMTSQTEKTVTVFP
jgi:selenide, water dikinase